MTQTDTRNRYGSLCAEIYDLDKPVGSLFDAAYYQGRLKDLDGPVLEAAVGTGRLLIPLLEAGIAAEGFDHSAQMLAVCAANAAARGLSPALAQARFQDFAYDRSFAAIIVPASSFILIDDYDEALGVLDRFRDHLEPGGLLLVDLPPMSFFEAQARPRSWTAANGDRLTLESHLAISDPIAQRRVNHDRYERWRDGRLVESELELFAFRVWGMKEFELALARAGFEDIEVSGGYRPGRPPRPGDGILNFAARKPR
ncbi:MAG TPA: class I SAM-dependent methyltransferase [Phenylobacterium sp.]|nr:class I SAM-dependent methyltransferase [Phenylobacterium sp.]